MTALPADLRWYAPGTSGPWGHFTHVATTSHGELRMELSRLLGGHVKVWTGVDLCERARGLTATGEWREVSDPRPLTVRVRIELVGGKAV